jgi:hypothetical protein
LRRRFGSGNEGSKGSTVRKQGASTAESSSAQRRRRSSLPPKRSKSRCRSSGLSRYPARISPLRKRKSIVSIPERFQQKRNRRYTYSKNPANRRFRLDCPHYRGG